MRRLLQISMIAMVALMPMLVVSQVPDDEEDVYYILTEEADSAIARGDYKAAIDRIHDAISVDPANPTNVLLLSNLGILYGSLDQDSLALDAFNQANRIAPSMTVVLVNRGKLHLKGGNMSAAFADFDRTVQLDSLNADARYFRGMVLLYGGDYQGAEIDFDILESISPDSFNTYLAKATLYSMTGRDMQAIPCFKFLVEREPSPEYFAGLAGCYIAVDYYSDAASTIEDGLKHYPNDPELYYYRAKLNKQRYQLAQAKKDAQTAIKLGANPVRVSQLFE